MNQEIKDKLEQAAAYHQGSGLDFMAGAQTILENPEEWGLFTPDQMKGQRNLYRGQLDKILTEYEAMKSKHNHVETWYESHIQKEKYREALEDVDRELAHEGFANSTGEGVDRARDIIKEVLKHNEQ